MNRIRANDASTLVDDKVGQRHKHTDRQTGRRTVTWELIGKNWGETLYKGATNSNQRCENMEHGSRDSWGARFTNYGVNQTVITFEPDLRKESRSRSMQIAMSPKRIVYFREMTACSSSEGVGCPSWRVRDSSYAPRCSTEALIDTAKARQL